MKTAVRSMRQAHLVSGTTERTCWLSTEKKPQVGNRVTLKNSEDPARLWTIRSLSEPRAASDIHDDWKVGGL